MKKSFGARLRELRGSASQAEIARIFGVAQQTYCGWEKDQRKPNFIELCGICTHYGISADWLLGLSPHRAPVPVAPITATNSAVNTNGSTRIHVTQAEERLLAIIESQQATIHKLVH